jgi:hypothetical protein
VLLLGVSLWQIGVRPLVGPYFKFALSGLCLLGFVAMIYKAVTTPSLMPTAGVPNFFGAPRANGDAAPRP